MKKIMSLVFFFCFTVLSSSAFCNEWKQDFFNTALSFNYDIAVENAVEAGISINEIVLLSTELGYDRLYTACKIYNLTDGLIKSGKYSGDLQGLESIFVQSGIESETVERAKELSLSGLQGLIDSGAVFVPGSVEISMNYERYYGPGDEEIDDGRARADRSQNQGEQGLGFGDDPGLGFRGALAMQEFNFSFGSNISIFVSPSTP